MNTDDERELQNEDSWDFEHAEVQAPRKPPRAVVSVAFSRDDYARVVSAARRSNKKISEYIRDAALALVESPATITQIEWSGYQTALAFEQPASITSVRVERREDRNYIREMDEDNERLNQ